MKDFNGCKVKGIPELNLSGRIFFLLRVDLF